jgi:acyl-ACP thioesterase
MKNLEEKYLQHESDISIAVNDTDFKAHIKPSAVMGYCQDIATEHADILGIGYDDMRAQNSGWVMIRMSFKVMQYPKVGELLKIKTFPENPGKSDVDRGYYIINKAGETIITASSKWCVIDTETHRIKRLAPFFEKFSDSEYIPFPPFEDANYKIDKLPDYSMTYENPVSYTVQVTDLDYNVHMNNARYGDVVLNVCGMEMLQINTISRFDINFMSQLFAGDSFDVYKTQAGNITYIEAKKTSTDTVVFRARAEWQKYS